MRRWPLLHNRNFMLLWSGETLSELGSQTATVAYPLLVLALTGSAAKAGVVGLAKWLPLPVCALPAGMLADRLDRRRVMIACDGIRLLGAASIVAALAAGRPPYAQVVVVAFLDGALFTVFYTCERAALRQVVTAGDVPDAVAQNEARFFGASILGPPLGGVLFSAARALPFAADAASYACSLTAVSLIRTPFQSPSAAPSGTSTTLRERVGGGLAWLWRHAFFRTAMLLFAAGNPVFTGLSLLAVLLAHARGASPSAIGAMFAIIGGCGLCGAILAGPLRRRVAPKTAIVGEQWILVGVALTLLAARAPLLIGLLVGACELGTPLTNSIVAGARTAIAPDHLQGRVQAASTLLSMSLGWLGPLAVGVLFQSTGATTTTVVLIAWTIGLAGAATLAPALREGPPSATGVASAVETSTQPRSRARAIDSGEGLIDRRRRS